MPGIFPQPKQSCPVLLRPARPDDADARIKKVPQAIGARVRIFGSADVPGQLKGGDFYTGGVLIILLYLCAV